MSTGETVHIQRPDGGHIAVWPAGQGPALVLVHGSMSDHTAFDPLIAALGDRVASYAMDRRGFGASPDARGYNAEREFDDVAAVADAIAERTGGPVALFGHSWGASCAMGAAVRTKNLRQLLLYEPSLGLKYPPGFIDQVEAQLAAGDAEGAILSVLVTLAGMTDAQVAAYRSSPVWPSRLATAPTIAREARIEDGWVHEPGQFDAIAVPTIFLSGTASPADLIAVTHSCAAIIPGARIRRLEGHDHFAYRTHPAEIAAVIIASMEG
jgi:pimeloyl-ACP methyl ester carboxylesterase